METKWLQTQDGRISYEDSGVGPLVIALPSLGDVRAEYRFLAPLLVKAGWRVVKMDLRGLGESSTDWDDFSVASVGRDLLALIHALDAGPAVVIGTSMAAGAGIWAAAEEPGRISGLVLIGPAVHGEVSRPNRLLYRALFARPWGPALWVKYYNTLYPTRKPEDFDRYTTALGNNLREPGRVEAVLHMMLASKAASEERLPRVTAPARIIMGSKDPDFKDPEGEARWVAEQVRGEYFMVEGAGHYPHAELPEITAPLVIDFLRVHHNIEENSHVA
jgi:pimeloyl-ACP methyl ester carboxylesterase